MEQALIKTTYPFTFFTNDEWSEDEVYEIISAAVEFAHKNARDFDSGSPATLAEIISILMPVLLEQSVVRSIKFPTELHNKPREGWLYFWDLARETYKQQGEPISLREFADVFLSDMMLPTVSMTYREWFSNDLRHILDAKQVFYLDNEVSLRMYEQAGRTIRIARKIRNAPGVSVW